MGTPLGGDFHDRSPRLIRGRVARAARMLRLRARSLFRSSAANRDLDDELRDHLERLIESYRAAGMSADGARRAAAREFGNVTGIQEECRDMRRIRPLEDLFRDVRYGVTSLAANPLHALAIVLSLALGIGANTAIFTLVNVLMLRSIPVAAPDRLVEAGRITQYGRGGSFSYPIYERLRDRNTALSGVLAISNSTLRATTGNEDEPVGRFVSSNFFDVLGISPALGQFGLPPDRSDGDGTVAVISHRLWLRMFGGEPSAVGKTLVVEDIPFTVVGVLPEHFAGLHAGQHVDFLLPLAAEPRFHKRTWLTNTDFNFLAIVGRLKPGHSIDDARADVQPVFAAFIDEFAATLKNAEAQRTMRTHRISLESAHAGLSGLRRQFSRAVLLLMGTVTLVLLIACANVMNLLFSRAVARQREMALRLSLGATRGRLVRQLLTESLMLGCVGGAGGLLLAAWATPLLVRMIADSDPLLSFDLRPDARVLAFTAVLSLGSAVLAGIVPAFRASRHSVAPSVHGDGRTLNLGRSSTWWSRGLIAAQVALSLLLLVGASLLATSLHNLRTFDAGFERDRVLMMSLNPAKAGYKGERWAGYYRQVLDTVRAMPGVQAATLSMMTPVAGGGIDLSLNVEGKPREEGAVVYVNIVSDGYFTTMGTRFLLGSDLSPSDSPTAQHVAVINEALAKRYFPGESPVGRRVTLGRGESLEILGVTADAKYLTLRETTVPTIYVNALQRTQDESLTLSVKTAGDPDAMAMTVRRQIQAIAPSVPIGRAGTLSAQVDKSIVNERLVARLLGAFSALALLLAAIGLYGVLGYAVTRRTSEIGVRLALGATRASVVWSILRESWTMVAAGAIVGVPAALALTRVLSTLVYEVSTTDPWIMTYAVISLFGLAMIAAWLPAWRASRVDPIVALRHQ